MESLSVWRSAETLSSPLLNFVYRSRESRIKITVVFKNNNNNKKNHKIKKEKSSRWKIKYFNDIIRGILFWSCSHFVINNVARIYFDREIVSEYETHPLVKCITSDTDFFYTIILLHYIILYNNYIILNVYAMGSIWYICAVKVDRYNIYYIL